jgi:hypothetical protein
MGDRGLGNGQHEFFITVDYGQGLIGKHMDVDVTLVKKGDRVAEGGPIGSGPSAEFMLIDLNRTDGERAGSGSTVSPFDYLREDLKAALVARHVAEVVEPFFKHGQSAANSHPWEPALTNPMLFHKNQQGTLAGEWILSNKGWRTPDPTYFDVLAIFDVSNAKATSNDSRSWILIGHCPVARGTAMDLQLNGRLPMVLARLSLFSKAYPAMQSTPLMRAADVRS